MRPSDSSAGATVISHSAGKAIFLEEIGQGFSGDKRPGAEEVVPAGVAGSPFPDRFPLYVAGLGHARQGIVFAHVRDDRSAGAALGDEGIFHFGKFGHGKTLRCQVFFIDGRRTLFMECGFGVFPYIAGDAIVSFRIPVDVCALWLRPHRSFFQTGMEFCRPHRCKVLLLY